VLFAVLLGGVGVYAFRRPSIGPTPVPVGLQPDRRAALLLEIAQLDERMDASAVSDAERREFSARRAALLQHLTVAG